MKKDDPYITESSLRRILADTLSVTITNSLSEFRKSFREEIAQDIQASANKVTTEIIEVINDLSTQIDDRFNRIEKRMDNNDIGNYDRDSRLTKHERWHYLVAKKIDIRLPQEI